MCDGMYIIFTYADLTASELDPYGVKVLHNLNEDGFF